jgi:hypothetical protein
MLGTLPGYWLGADDGRPSSPFLSKALWHQRLLDAGLSGADVVLDDYPEPADCTTLMVSRNIGDAVEHTGMDSTNGVNGINGFHDTSGQNGLSGTSGVKSPVVTLVCDIPLISLLRLCCSVNNFPV